MEVHQNGELLSKTSRPLHKKGSIFLTSDPNGELAAPFYPLPTDIRILKITKRGVEVDLDPNWEGFTTYEGKIEDINSDRRSAYTHLMKLGDYGSIAYNDLRLLIRIGYELRSNPISKPRRSDFRGRLSELWLGERADLKWLGFGLLASAWLMGGFVLGLLRHPDDRPRHFIDLRNEYTLPFINPSHLRNGPESLQTSYNRQAPLRSSVAFTQDFTNTVLGFNAGQNSSQKVDSRIFGETMNRYQSLHDERKNRERSIMEERSKFEKNAISDQRNALISMPVIVGESFAGSLIRLEDKLKIWYESTQLTLSLRKEVTASFKQDPVYNFNEYRDPGKSGKRKVSVEAASPDEESLYKEAESLADTAAYQLAHMQKHREPQTRLDANNASPLAVTPDLAFASLQPVKSFGAFNQKFEQIEASVFDPDKPKIVREPMIGTLDPRLVQETIDRYRFELQLCYELALRRNQEAKGSMEWQWHLDTQGQVYDIELVQSSISDSKMIDCVKSKIASWKWPRPQKGSIQISFPFHFRPAKG